MGRPGLPIAGQRFGRLVAIERAGTAVDGYVRWRCQCDCGSTHYALGSNLVRGRVKSCGCATREAASRTGKVWGPINAKARMRQANHDDPSMADAVAILCSTWKKP